AFILQCGCAFSKLLQCCDARALLAESLLQGSKQIRRWVVLFALSQMRTKYRYFGKACWAIGEAHALIVMTSTSDSNDVDKSWECLIFFSLVGRSLSALFQVFLATNCKGNGH